MAFPSNLGETWNSYFPVNSTTYGPSNIIRLRIPKSNLICDLSRAFISLSFNLPFQYQITNVADLPKNLKLLSYRYLYSKEDITKFNRVYESTKRSTEVIGDTSDERDVGTLAIRNAGTIFDIVDMQINGRQLYHDDFNQTSCMLAQFNKSNDWIRAHSSTFLDLSEKRNPISSLMFDNLTELDSPDATGLYPKTTETKELIIPLSLIYPILENVTDWPSFLIDDTLEFNLYVSKLYKFLVDYVYISNKGHSAVRTISEASVIKYGYVAIAKYDDAEDMNGGAAVEHKFEGQVSFFTDEATISNVQLFVPTHNPTPSEQTQMRAAIEETSGLAYSFRHWKTVSYLSRYISQTDPQFTQQINFNTTVNNMFGVSMLALQPSTEVVFEKPRISTFQLNLGPWELASNGTHIYDNYSRGGDMLNCLLDNCGQTNLKYYQTLNKEVLIDHAITSDQANNIDQFYPTGSYMTYYDISPGDELGVGSNEFANLITYKYTIEGNTFVSNRGLENGKTYCAIQTLSTLIIDRTGVTCINPNSRFLSSDSLSKLTSYYEDRSDRFAHGLSDSGNIEHGTFGAILPTLFDGLIGGIKSLHKSVRNARSARHMNWFKARLTPKEYEDNEDALRSSSYYLMPKQWKKHYRQIISQRPPEDPNTAPKEHGLFLRHGIKDITYDTSKGGGHRDTDVNMFRLRLAPWSRFMNYIPRNLIEARHGLVSAYHGLGSFFGRLFRGFGKKLWSKIPSLAKPTIDTGKQILHSLMTGKITKDEAKQAAKIYAKKTGIDILHQVQDAAAGSLSEATSKPTALTTTSGALQMPHGKYSKAALYSIYRANPNLHVKRFVKRYGNEFGGLKEIKPIIMA